MAGSNKWFIYTTNTGKDFGIRLDESNTEAINGGDGDAGEPPSTNEALPRNIKPRTLVYKSPDGFTVRRCVALTQAAFAAAPGTIPGPTAGSTLTLKQYIGESATAVFGFDTGLQDGDAT